ncbi:ComEC/Rec2 family competence protein [Candidatus Jorgensenbacteria bacterium]|nr:ComEC/Rec2 family competence protein [Candidatus Jorgensenbacteria bacterium]
MRSYDIFFFSAAFFIFGVFLSSVGLKSGILWIVLGLEIIYLVLWLTKREFRLLNRVFRQKIFLWLIGLTFFIIIGSLYYTWDDLQFRRDEPLFGREDTFIGIVRDKPVFKNNLQELVVSLESPSSGNILVKIPKYPAFKYGDEVRIKGKINKPEPSAYIFYLQKEKIHGISSFPYFEYIASGRGSSVKAWLFSVRDRIVESFRQILPAKESAFLSGLTLGGTSEFTPEFREAMQRSGTTHLVALSGYNITIIVWAAMGVFIWFFGRRWSFMLTVLVIVGFVFMTGAEASVVRAAVMGILVLIAHEAGRIYDMRNAIVLAGLIMVLANPKVLMFDIGFQLSFLALLGIVYVRPALLRIFHFSEEPNFLSWKDNLATTAAAQLAVVPVLITQFGSFSPISFLANLLILEIVPVTMGFGFLIAAASFVSYYGALVLGWFTWVLLRFEILVIEFTSTLSIPLAVELNWVLVAVYYILIACFMVVTGRVRKS